MRGWRELLLFKYLTTLWKPLKLEAA